ACTSADTRTADRIGRRPGRGRIPAGRACGPAPPGSRRDSSGSPTRATPGPAPRGGSIRAPSSVVGHPGSSATSFVEGADDLLEERPRAPGEPLDVRAEERGDVPRVVRLVAEAARQSGELVAVLGQADVRAILDDAQPALDRAEEVVGV